MNNTIKRMSRQELKDYCDKKNIRFRRDFKTDRNFDIFLRYMQGKESAADIAQDYDISRQYILRIKDKVINGLRRGGVNI